MSRKKKISIAACLIGALALLTGGLIWQKTRVVVLEVGIFAGSNWDVANANSYVIIDKAVEKFEAEHDNVVVHYIQVVFCFLNITIFLVCFLRYVLSGKAVRA